MKTQIEIDHRVWKDWHDESEMNSAIGQLNVLLAPHGVRLRKTSEPFDDSLGLEAESVMPNTDFRGPAT